MPHSRMRSISWPASLAATVQGTRHRRQAERIHLQTFRRDNTPQVTFLMWSGSLRLNSSLSDDRSPLFEVVRDSVAESIRRTRFYIHALRLQSCSSFRIMQYFGQLS